MSPSFSNAQERISHASSYVSAASDHLPPVPGRMHRNANADHALGDELYVAIAGADENQHVRALAQNLQLEGGVAIVRLNVCVLRDP